MCRHSSSLIPLALLLAAVSLSACGRAGDPLRPSVAAAEAAKANDQPVPPPPVPNAQNPGKRFVLDGLLE